MQLSTRVDELLETGYSLDMAISQASYESTHPQVTYTYSTTEDGRITANAR
jgi:hypothetical protein